VSSDIAINLKIVTLRRSLFVSRFLKNYFDKVADLKGSGSSVRFERRFLDRESEIPQFCDSVKPLTKFFATDEGGSFATDKEGSSHVMFKAADFSTAIVGGGVLEDGGCVEEKIRFLACPEVMVARLFTQELDSNECLIMSGFKRFSDDIKDDEDPQVDLVEVRGTEFGFDMNVQYEKYLITTEIRKLYVSLLSR
jgi:hypothetical protein